MEGKDSEQLAQEINSVHREPHPYVTPEIFEKFSMRTVSFVGRVKEVTDKKKLILTRSDNKTEITVNNYKGPTNITGVIEIRGIVNKDGKTLSYGQHTLFGESFDLNGFDKMLCYYTGMCKDLIVS